MKPAKWMVYLTLVMFVILGMIWGYLNGGWDRLPVFPSYGVFINIAFGLILLALAVVFTLYFRRHKHLISDEFAETKKKYAIQIGVVIGALLFALMNLAFVIWPDLEGRTLIFFNEQDSPFSFGRLLGFLPMLAGIIIGQVAAWLKYR